MIRPHRRRRQQRFDRHLEALELPRGIKLLVGDVEFRDGPAPPHNGDRPIREEHVAVLGPIPKEIVTRRPDAEYPEEAERPRDPRPERDLADLLPALPASG